MDGILHEYNRSVEGKKYIWYGAYGSNMDENRIIYYIQGGEYRNTNKIYEGCEDKSHWIAEDKARFSGRMYFAKESSSWDYKGVAFYDPEGEGFTYMKLYKITEAQLHDIQLQECCSGARSGKTISKNHWYSRLACLGQHEDGCLIYTITCEGKYEENEPSSRYLKVILNGLEAIFGDEIDSVYYLKNCLPKY